MMSKQKSTHIGRERTSNKKTTKKDKQGNKDTTNDGEVIFVGVQHSKSCNNFANVIHNNSLGSNNWKTFLETVSKNSTSSSTKLEKKHKNISRPHSKLSQSNKTSQKLSKPDSMITCSDLEKRFGNKSPNNSGIQEKKTKSSLANVTEQHTKSSYAVGKLAKGKENELTKQIAMDCEMVGVDIGANNNMLARVSLVNAHGNCIYDKFVKPTEPVVSFRTHVSGIRPCDLVNAEDFKIVQQEVADIMKGRILVGHALKNDLRVLYLTHPKRDIRDTSRFHKFREGRTPALKKLAKKYLGVTIQEGEHNSIQDALATMQLYKMFRKEWESTLKYKNWKKQKYGPAQNKITIVNSHSVDHT